MRSIKVVILILLISMLWSCNKNDSKDLVFNFITYENEREVYGCQLRNGEKVIIVLDEQGRLENFSNYPLDSTYRQVVGFNEYGTIVSKVKMKNEGVEDGQGYYFYDLSGNLLGINEFRDGKKVNQSFSFHDSITFQIETISYYNDEKVYYRKSFDKHGKLIEVEGDKGY